MHNTKNNLIIGIANNYTFNDIKPFIISLRETGYNEDLVLFAETTDPTVKKNAHKYNITCIEYSAKYPFLFTVKNNDPILPPKSTKDFHLFSYRHIIYYQYLINNTQNYSHIMITDVRDVIFQANPFNWISDSNLHCFLEATGEKIKDDHAHNASWVKNALGEKTLTLIGNNPISCAGIVIGETTAIKDYITKMTNIIITNPNASGPTDQGLHNYLVHTDKLINMMLHKNNESPVLTIGRMPHGIIPLSHDKRFLNKDKSIPAILHQYDRHPDIDQRILKKYHSLPYRLKQLFKTIKKYKHNPRKILGSIKVFIKYGLI